MSDHADTIRTVIAFWDALLAERQQAQEDLDRTTTAANRIEQQLVRAAEVMTQVRDQRQQAIDALREAEHQCRENIRRAAFAPQIGTRYTENLRLAIADECRKLEDGIRAALVKLGEKP